VDSLEDDLKKATDKLVLVEEAQNVTKLELDDYRVLMEQRMPYIDQIEEENI
jgi:hypothetical protein